MGEVMEYKHVITIASMIIACKTTCVVVDASSTSFNNLISPLDAFHSDARKP
jgi:hypothetical protein